MKYMPHKFQDTGSGKEGQWSLRNKKQKAELHTAKKK